MTRRVWACDSPRGQRVVLIGITLRYCSVICGVWWRRSVPAISNVTGLTGHPPPEIGLMYPLGGFNTLRPVIATPNQRCITAMFQILMPAAQNRHNCAFFSWSIFTLMWQQLSWTGLDLELVGYKPGGGLSSPRGGYSDCKCTLCWAKMGRFWEILP